MTSPTLAQLDNTIYATDEDGDDSQGEEDQEDEHPKPRDWDHGRRLRRRGRPDVATEAQSILGGEQDEKSHAGNLEAETGDHDVRPQLWILVTLRLHAGDPAADTLEDQTDDVAGNEYLGVAGGLDPRHFGWEVLDDLTQTEVDACREECGSDGEADDLRQEAILAERVVMRYQSADVADDFGDTTYANGDPEGCLPSEESLD